MRIDDVLDIISACRRSRVKYRVYRALRDLRVATAGELADKAKTTVERVFQVMLGDGRDYRHDTSLLSIHVAEQRALAGVEAFAVTVRGTEAFPLVEDRLER